MRVTIKEWESSVDKDTPLDFGTNISVNGIELEGDLVLDPEKAISELLTHLGVRNVDVEFIQEQQ